MIPRPGFDVRAVVFDLDGLLIDSEGVWADAEREVVTALGHRWDPGIQALLFGKAARDAAAALAARLGDVDPEALERRLGRAAEERFRDGVPLRPGAWTLVSTLAGRLPLGVASNSRRVLVDLALAGTGLDELVDAVVGFEDVARPKPAPDPYRTACVRLGVDAGRTVAFEDSPVGVASACAAGLWVVGCPSIEGQSLDDAHTVVGSLADVDPRALLPAA